MLGEYDIAWAIGIGIVLVTILLVVVLFWIGNKAINRWFRLLISRR